MSETNTPTSNEQEKSSDRVVHRLQGGAYAIFCPACGNGHCLDSRWTFNGDFDKPTFRASLLVRGTVPVTNEEADMIMRGEPFEPKPLVCHSFITDGMIQFLDDCTHELRGQTVPLEKF